MRRIQPQPVAAVTGVRSTLLASSLKVAREAGLMARYRDALPSRYRDQTQQPIAPVWLPLEEAFIHYEAMNSLDLADEAVVRIGRWVGHRLEGAFLGAVERPGQSSIPPYPLQDKLDRVWSRLFDGGAIKVHGDESRDARVALRGLPLLEIPYFRASFRGVLSALIGSVATKCYVRELPLVQDRDAIDLLLSWT
jgi:hypothetical protein